MCGWSLIRAADFIDFNPRESLPQNTKLYVNRVAELLEIPIKIISVGPNRNQTIFI